MGILVLTTGGTIGAVAYPDPQSPPDISLMPSADVDLVKSTLDQPDFSFVRTRCISLEPRDSKLIDENYLLNVIDVIRKAPENEILITHGTDRILKSADFLFRYSSQHLAELRNKTILLTGSMIPLANGPGSDGFVNLVFALGQLSALEFGASENNGAIFIVLCDYEFPDTESGQWQPRLYRYRPGHYVKFYDEDGRYNRLKRVHSNDED